MNVPTRHVPVAVLHLRGPESVETDQCVLKVEHGALLRQVATLQRRLGDQVAEQARRLSTLEADNLRLRAELVRSRTAVLWGLHAAAVATPRRRNVPRSLAPVESPWREAQAVICQTGCAGHAHPWMNEQGQCRRTGDVCKPHGSTTAENRVSDPAR